MAGMRLSEVGTLRNSKSSTFWSEYDLGGRGGPNFGILNVTLAFVFHLIDPIHKGVSLFLSYINMNTINSLHHVKEHPKISNFLQFESHSSKSFKVRAI